MSRTSFPGGPGASGCDAPRVRPDGKVNINPQHAADPFYRWTMPPVELKVESAGNGIKTVLPNLDAIAKSLRRPVDYVAQYLKASIGSGFKLSGGRYVIMGQKHPDEIQKKIDGFITAFVLCTECKAPGTLIRVGVTHRGVFYDQGEWKSAVDADADGTPATTTTAAAAATAKVDTAALRKRGKKKNDGKTGGKKAGRRGRGGGSKGAAAAPTIVFDCGACGKVHSAGPALRDAEGKLLSYILKNPPRDHARTGGGGGGASGSRAEKGVPAEDNGDDLGGLLELATFPDFSSPSSTTARAQSAKEEEEEDEDLFSDDLGDAAILARQRAAGAGVLKLIKSTTTTTTHHVERSVEERVALFRTFVTSVPTPSANSIATEAAVLKCTGDDAAAACVAVLVDALLAPTPTLTDPSGGGGDPAAAAAAAAANYAAGLVRAVKAHHDVFATFVGAHPRLQVALLAAIEGVFDPARLAGASLGGAAARSATATTAATAATAAAAFAAAALPKALRVLFTLHELELVEDAVFLSWHSGPPAHVLGAEMRVNVAPFIGWIADADSDDDGDDDDDDDDGDDDDDESEVVFDNAPVPAPANDEGDDAVDDAFIDDI